MMRGLAQKEGRQLRATRFVRSTAHGSQPRRRRHRISCQGHTRRTSSPFVKLEPWLRAHTKFGGGMIR